MKINNRGFLLAESLIVSTFVLTVLMLLYIQFDNLTTNYKNSYNYNNVESIYDLSSVSNYLLANNYNLSDKLTETTPYVIIYKDESCNIDAGIIDPFCDNLINKMDAKTIIYTSSDISIIQNYISSHDDTNINQSFREFISRVETNTIQNKGRLFAEFNNGTYATIALDIKTTNPDEMSPVELCKNEVVTTSGDGLYIDTSKPGSCTYKGANPNNYITFNNEMWRIINVETDGTIKIMRNESIGSRAWDTTGDEEGTNNWARPATLNTYLNGEYLNSITTNKDKIKTNAVWSIGKVTENGTDLSGQMTAENETTWTGSIALPTASEYLKANSNAEQCGNLSLNNTNHETCKTTNWMYNIVPSGAPLWLLTPITSLNSAVYKIFPDATAAGSVSTSEVYYPSPVSPSLYLAPDTILTGKGTQTEPYQIK